MIPTPKTTTFTVLDAEFTAVKTYFQTKIDANGGAAPWLIGTKTLSSETRIYDRKGKYLLSFGFDFNKFNSAPWYRAMTLNQLSDMIMRASEF